MLTHAHIEDRAGDTALGSVHNYYERLVYEQLWRASERAQTDSDFLADVLCVALNHLPPRYVRHDVDMTFYLSSVEQDEMLDKVAHAVNAALTYVEARVSHPSNTP